MSKVLSALMGMSMIGLAGVTDATEPVALTDSQMDNVTAGTVTLYQDSNFNGPSLTLATSDGNLGNNLIALLPPKTWNDATSSIVVQPGTSATFYRDINYSGPSKTLTGGEYPSVEAVGIPNDSISSVSIK